MQGEEDVKDVGVLFPNCSPIPASGGLFSKLKVKRPEFCISRQASRFAQRAAAQRARADGPSDYDLAGATVGLGSHESR